MAEHTTLLSFNIPAFKAEAEIRAAEQAVADHLKAHGFTTRVDLGGHRGSAKGFLVIYFSSSGSHASIEAHPNGLITVDIHQLVSEGGSSSFDSETVDKLQEKIEKSLKASRSKSLPSIRRGEEVDVYYPTVDGRLIEYDIDKVVYHKDSPFQNILIVHTASFGNMLILDGDINMSESELNYTRKLMCYGELSYTGKTALILGGGDGGLLNEIVKENPKMVIMADIDQMAVDACKKHLPRCCETAFDNLKGSNYEVIIGDAMKLLQEYTKTGQTFDYVLYDITVVPITPEATGDSWDFLRKAHTLGLKVLKPGGKFLAHANATLAVDTLAMYEKELDKLNVTYTHKDSFCPTFHESWRFYQLSSK